MMKWPFNNADVIMSKLGGPVTGKLSAYWEQGMEYTAWILEPKAGATDLDEISWLNDTNYIAEIFDPGTGKIVYHGPITFVQLETFRAQKYPKELTKDLWLNWVHSNYPARFTKKCT